MTAYRTPTAATNQRARTRHNSLSNPAIPWPIASEKPVLLFDGADVLPAPEATVTPSAAAAATFATASQNSTGYEGGSGTDSGSSSGFQFNSLFPLIPTAISAVCLAILASKIVDSLQTRPALTEGIETKPPSPTRVLLAEGSEEDFLSTLVEEKPIEEPVENAPLFSNLKDGMSYRKLDRAMGMTLATLKIVMQLQGLQTDMKKFEMDPQLASLLNAALPSLLEAVDEDRTLMDNLMKDPCDSARSVVEVSDEELEESEPLFEGIIQKCLIPDVGDSIRRMTQSAILLTSQWLSVTSLVRALLPESLRAELEFLGNYLMYCVESETALDLPYLFPADFETDAAGAVIKINQPMSTFILRALARTAAGVAVALLPYVRRRKTLKKLQVATIAGGRANRPSLNSVRTPASALTNRLRSSSLTAAEVVHGGAPAADPQAAEVLPVVPALVLPKETSALAAARPEQELWSGRHELPDLLSKPSDRLKPHMPEGHDFGDNVKKMMEATVTKTSITVTSTPAVIQVPSSAMSPMQPSLTRSTAIDVPMRRSSSRKKKIHANSSVAAASPGGPAGAQTPSSGSPLGSWRSAEIKNASAPSSLTSSPELSPAGEDWEAFKIKEAGIPLSVLRLEFEALRAGFGGPLNVSGENNILDAW
ncbi:hypothetical protein HK101_001338 [Irineochytrium annulatum]|nr:hypothetical protein HK101_001338 [Irineochytrium annulatum]